jgi:hypothetical protein
MMLRPPVLLTLGLGLALATTSLAAEDLAAGLPASAEATTLANVARLRSDFPELMATGPVRSVLSEIAARGFPAPLEELDQLGVVARFGGPDGLAEVATLARGRAAVVPLVEALAENRGVTLERLARRGLALVRGTFEGRPTEFADLPAGLAYGAFDVARNFLLGEATQSTLQTGDESFRQRYETGLDEGVYALSRIELDDDARDRLEDSKLSKLAQLSGASLDVRRTGEDVRLAFRATLTSGLKARIAAPLLRSKLSNAASKMRDPDARAVLEAAELRRDGKTLVLELEAPRSTFGAGLEALIELAAERRQAKHTD